MKQIISIISISLIMLLIGCKKEAPTNEVNNEEPVISSFKFESKNNPGIIDFDVVGEINGHDITVRLPKTVLLTKLVASFEVANENTVTVNGVSQKSGITANDFSSSIDYLVSSKDGKANALYSVKIIKSAGEWKPFNSFNKIPVKSALMKINPKDNLLYLVINDKKTDKLSVFKLKNEQFVSIGNEVSGSVKSSAFDMAFSKSGNMYLCYSLNQPQAKVFPLTMLKYDGSNWSTIKNESSDFTSSKINIAVLSDKEVIVNHINESKKSKYKRNSLLISSYDGKMLKTVKVVTGGEQGVWSNAICSSGNYVYSAFIYRKINNGVNFGHEVLQYNSGKWTSLRNNFLQPGATQTGMSILGIKSTDNGTVYLLTADDAAQKGVYHFRVEKYLNDKWENVGSPLPYIHGDRHDMAILSIAPEGTPYVAYYDNKTTTVFVSNYEETSKSWSEPVAVVKEKITSLNFDFASSGAGYIAFTDANGEEKIYIYK